MSPASVVVTDAVSESPIGVRPQREPGYVSVGAAVMLGRLGAEQLADVAEASNAAADASLRISPWRHVVLTNVATRDAAVVVARLEQIGLVTDPDHPANVVVACTGSRGCAAGLVDAPADARVLIDLLAERPVEARPRSVHVSGCEKGCASPSQAAVTIVGGPAPETYTFYCGSSDDSRFGTAVQSGLDARTAVEQVVVAGEQRAR